MDQSLVSDSSSPGSVPFESGGPIAFLPADLAEGEDGGPFVAIVRSRDEFCRWLHNPSPGLQWLQVEGLMSDPDAWAAAAHGPTDIPLDVLLSAPGSEFSDLYRLVDVCAARNVRVSMPAAPGFLRAVRLAASLRLPVRLLPGQPGPEVLAELAEAATFYLFSPMVETPVEFFHSTLASMCGADTGTLWTILEEDPALFLHHGLDGRPKLPRFFGPVSPEVSPLTFVGSRLQGLVEQNAECATCRWQQKCGGYFKWPDPAYTCRGVKELFSTIEAAANELRRELAGRDCAHGVVSEPGAAAPPATGSDA